MVRTVLCYGDSNTFGHATVPRPDGRYGPDERWPGVLRASLGAGWLVIEEGLNGRTTVSDDPVEGAEKNGKTYLYPCLTSHRPLDVVIIMLGTNDMKHRFGKSAWDIAEGVAALATITRSAGAGRNGGAPEVILVSPPPILRRLPGYEDMFEGAYPKSQEMAKRYKAVTQRLGVRFLDAGKVARSSRADGFHLDPEAHATLGKALAAELKKLALPA